MTGFFRWPSRFRFGDQGNHDRDVPVLNCKHHSESDHERFCQIGAFYCVPVVPGSLAPCRGGCFDGGCRGTDQERSTGRGAPGAPAGSTSTSSSGTTGSTCRVILATRSWIRWNRISRTCHSIPASRWKRSKTTASTTSAATSAGPSNDPRGCRGRPGGDYD